MAKTSQYYVTESEVSKLLGQSGLPATFQQLFARDYVSLKSETDLSSNNITVIFERLDIDESNIASNTARISVTESGLGEHIADNSAHNATGNIVGTDDYAQAAIGGTVFLAAASGDASPSVATATLSPNAAGAVYSQADAATWVLMLNEHKSLINQLKTDLNAAIVQLNLSLLTERDAKQRAT